MIEVAMGIQKENRSEFFCLYETGEFAEFSIIITAAVNNSTIA
jgi:hypothetical protein